jgi:hypothetical protein
VRQQLAERPPPPKPTALWPAPTRLPFCMDRPAPPLEMQPAKPPEQPPDSEQPPPDTEEQPPDREEPPPDSGDTNSDAVLRVLLTGVLDIEAIVRTEALHGLRGWRGKPSQKTQRACALRAEFLNAYDAVGIAMHDIPAHWDGGPRMMARPPSKCVPLWTLFAERPPRKTTRAKTDRCSRSQDGLSPSNCTDQIRLAKRCAIWDDSGVHSSFCRDTSSAPIRGLLSWRALTGRGQAMERVRMLPALRGLVRKLASTIYNGRWSQFPHPYDFD